MPSLVQVVLVEDKKWGAEERDLLYQVMYCYFCLPTRMLALLIPSGRFLSVCSNASARL